MARAERRTFPACQATGNECFPGHSCLFPGFASRAETEGRAEQERSGDADADADADAGKAQVPEEALRGGLSLGEQLATTQKRPCLKGL